MGGKIFVIGIGAGEDAGGIARVGAALAGCEAVLGYRKYLEQIAELVSGKRVIASGMGAELERCREAIALAKSGRRVAMISSGDPGIYGMAGPVLELLAAEPDIAVEIVPNITAAAYAAAALGAPLMLDFAAISLSDLLIPLEMIVQRVRGALAGDFVMVFYNPQSTTRTEPLAQALAIIRAGRGPQTPVGVVWNAGRTGERKLITTIDELRPEEIDMNSILIVGNSQTKIIGGWLVTPRGYEL